MSYYVIWWLLEYTYSTSSRLGFPVLTGNTLVTVQKGWSLTPNACHSVSNLTKVKRLNTLVLRIFIFQALIMTVRMFPLPFIIISIFWQWSKRSVRIRPDLYTQYLEMLTYKKRSALIKYELISNFNPTRPHFLSEPIIYFRTGHLTDEWWKHCKHDITLITYTSQSASQWRH